ncbi:1284_t:CDS:1, partial [Gigaspora margarita]
NYDLFEWARLYFNSCKGNNEHSELPGYLCNCNSFYNTEPSSSSTNAITM